MEEGEIMAKRKGDCYQVAAELVLYDPAFRNAVVAHGEPILRPTGERYGHAWVELDGQVVDRSNGLDVMLPREVYYSWGHINEARVVRYAHDEVAQTLMDV